MSKFLILGSHDAKTASAEWRASPEQALDLRQMDMNGDEVLLAHLHAFDSGLADQLNQWCIIAPNPLTEDSVFHTSIDAPAIKTWTDVTLPVGYIYLRSQALLNSESWTRPATVCITVEQGGRTAGKIFAVDGVTPVQFGLYSTGETARIRVDVTRAPDSPFEGSSVKVLAFWVYQPVTGVDGEPRLYDLGAPGGAREGTALINANQGGFMNRMIGLLGTIHTAERSGNRALAWWGPNQHCAAHLSDIFDLDDQSRVDGDDYGEGAETYTFYAEDPHGTTVLPLDGLPPNAIIHSITPFMGSDGVTPTHAELGEIFRRFRLHPAIRAKLDRHKGTDFKKVIGLHVRRPYPNGAFAEQEQAKFKLGEDLFINLIGDLQAAMPQYEHVLLCTNSFETEARLKDRFPGYVITNEKDSIDNTSDHVAVQDAVVDQVLMSRCDFMFSQSTSIFGMFASAVGATNMFSLTPQSDLDHYEFWKFEKGLHCDTFASDRTLAELIVRQGQILS